MKAKISLLCLLMASVCPIAVIGQKLPARQENSIYAPAGVKVDGKTSEWGTLQAYNPATEITYTMANDNDKLYFICSSTVPEAIQKIQLSGITLSISAVDKKSVIEPVAITYPIVPWVNTQINYDLREPAPLNKLMVSSINNKISGHLKEIKISGVKEFPDGSVSVYNDKGIMGGHYINENKVYTYELSFPLNLIRSLINDKDTFNYKVQVNGQDKSIIVTGGGGIGDYSPSDQAVPHNALYDTAPTYFNASYKLAKK